LGHQQRPPVKSWRAFFFAREAPPALGFTAFVWKVLVLTVLMRLVALVMIVTALVLLGADALTSLEKGGEVTVRSLGLIWSVLDPASLAAFKDRVQHNAPFLAQTVYSALAMPGWGLIGVVGVLIAFIFGRRPGVE
jgi:hypothetical protein